MRGSFWRISSGGIGLAIGGFRTGGGRRGYEDEGARNLFLGMNVTSYELKVVPFDSLRWEGPEYSAPRGRRS